MHGSTWKHRRAVCMRCAVKSKPKLMPRCNIWQWAPTLLKTQSTDQDSRISSSRQPAKSVSMATNWSNIYWCAANWPTTFPIWSKSMWVFHSNGLGSGSYPPRINPTFFSFLDLGAIEDIMENRRWSIERRIEHRSISHKEHSSSHQCVRKWWKVQQKQRLSCTYRH